MSIRQQKLLRSNRLPQVHADNIDLTRGNVSHVDMKLSKQHKSLSILALTAFVLLTLALQATAQQSNPDRQQPRGQRPDEQAGDADVRVWVGVDVLPGGLTGDGNATNLPTLSDQNQNAQFAGVWSTETIPGLVLTLQLDGNFSLATSVDLERRCSSGVERGSWIASPDTNELLFHIQTDTNGRCGFSNLESPLAVVKTGTGLTLITNDSEAGEQKMTLLQSEP